MCRRGSLASQTGSRKVVMQVESSGSENALAIDRQNSVPTVRNLEFNDGRVDMESAVPAYAAAASSRMWRMTCLCWYGFAKSKGVNLCQRMC
jgi:hypothetical protein